ncbi:MAG: 5'-nucleotidase, lipoprotein e(P4) family [Dehalococcoidia bacterium]
MIKWKASTKISYLVIAAIVTILLMTGCSSTEQATNGETVEYDKNGHYVMAVLWFQTSAEARALYYQAFNLAEMKLDEALQSQTGDEKLAVIVDIDETVLDNSPCRAELIKTDKDYATCWLEWVDLIEAKPLPGAKEFLDYTASCDVEVFYVSNRFEAQREVTRENLLSVGFPYADDDHIYLREGGPSKESRRQAIAEDYQIILLIGDNLNDFSDVFEDKLVPDRAAEVDSLKDEFGSRFIILPNPMYGDWEDAVYEYGRALSDAEEDTLRKEMLEGYSE